MDIIKEQRAQDIEERSFLRERIILRVPLESGTEGGGGDEDMRGEGGGEGGRADLVEIPPAISRVDYFDFTVPLQLNTPY